MKQISKKAHNTLIKKKIILKINFYNKIIKIKKLNLIIVKIIKISKTNTLLCTMKN
jgi:hypothetical protein